MCEVRGIPEPRTVRASVPLTPPLSRLPVAISRPSPIARPIGRPLIRLRARGRRPPRRHSRLLALQRSPLNAPEPNDARVCLQADEPRLFRRGRQTTLGRLRVSGELEDVHDLTVQGDGEGGTIDRDLVVIPLADGADDQHPVGWALERVDGPSSMDGGAVRPGLLVDLDLETKVHAYVRGVVVVLLLGLGEGD